MALNPSAGDLREVLNIQNYIEIDDGYGGIISEWQTAFVAPARIRTLKGGETVIASRLTGTQTLVATIRYQPEIENAGPDWRAKNGRSETVYDIKSITIDERKAFVDILMETGAVS